MTTPSTVPGAPASSHAGRGRVMVYRDHLRVLACGLGTDDGDSRLGGSAQLVGGRHLADRPPSEKGDAE
jgi:hypothetical protein